MDLKNHIKNGGMAIFSSHFYPKIMNIEDLILEKTQLNQTISELRVSLSNPAQVSWYDKNSETVITSTSSSARRALQAELKTTIEDRDVVNIKLEAILDSINKSSLKNDNDNVITEKYTKLDINEKNEINKISKDQIKNTLQTKPELELTNPKKLTEDKNQEHISSFEDLIKLSSRKREIELKYDLEKNVNLNSIMSNSFGFGGTNATLVFEKV